MHDEVGPLAGLQKLLRQGRAHLGYMGVGQQYHPCHATSRIPAPACFCPVLIYYIGGPGPGEHEMIHKKKKELRKKVQELRDAIDPEQRKLLSARVAD